MAFLETVNQGNAGTEAWPVSVTDTATVTVAGPVTIAETPTVAITGTVAVSGTFSPPTGTQTVVVAGSVTIAETPTVAISGTVAVSGTFSPPTGTQTVVVAGTSTVEVAGTSTVTVAGTITVEDVADGPVAPGTAASSCVLTGAVIETAVVSGTVNEQAALRMDANLNLRANIYGNPGSFQNVSATATGTVTLEVPAGTKWIIQSAAIIINSSTHTGTRTVTLVAYNPSGVGMAYAPSPVGYAASTDSIFNFAEALSLATAAINGYITAPCAQLCLGPSFLLQGVIGGVGGGTDSATLSINVIVLPD